MFYIYHKGAHTSYLLMMCQSVHCEIVQNEFYDSAFAHYTTYNGKYNRLSHSCAHCTQLATDEPISSCKYVPPPTISSTVWTNSV